MFLSMQSTLAHAIVRSFEVQKMAILLENHKGCTHHEVHLEISIVKCLLYVQDHIHPPVKFLGPLTSRVRSLYPNAGSVWTIVLKGCWQMMKVELEKMPCPFDHG